MFPALELPKASVMFFDTPVSILLLIASSSAPDTLARCFFNGLPTNAPFRAPLIAFDDSSPLILAEDASGGVVDRLDDGRVLPEAGAFAASLLLLEDKDAAEC